MIRSGKRIRFSDREVGEFHKIGIDLVGVRTDADLEAAFSLWLETLEAERPGLFDKIAQALIQTKRMKRGDNACPQAVTFPD